MTNNLAPAVRFPGSTDDWEQRKLGDVVKNIGTGNSKFQIQEKSSDASYAILGSTSVIGYDNNFDFEGNFVLTARVGANAGTLYQHSGKVKISDNTVYIQSDNPSFLYNLLNRFDLKKLSFGTGQPLVKSSELKKLALNFPNKEEQEKIGNFFNQLDYTIALHQRELDNLKATKQGFFGKMFPKEGGKVPEVRFPGFVDDWNQRELSEVSKMFDNLRIPVTASDRIAGDIPYYGANGIQDYVEGYTHDGEFVLIAEDGANDLVNYPVNYINGRAWINNHAHVVSGNDSELSNLFLVSRIRSMNILPWLVGGGRAKLNGEVLKKLPITIPSYDEQLAIGIFFKQLDDTVNLHQQELEKIKQIKQAFLQKMFI